MIRSDFPSVVFDFDYTLADSSKGAIACIKYALQRLGIPITCEDDAIRRTIGLSLPRVLEALAGPEHAHRADDFHRLFVERADRVMAELTRVYESVPQSLRSLKGQGIATGIVSTKFRYRIETILGREGLLDLFDVIVGGEDVQAHKPDPQGLLMAVDRLGATPDGCIYVGDSPTDAQTARAAGVPFVAVLSGVTPREEFAEYETHAILDSLAELPAMAGHPLTAMHGYE